MEINHWARLVAAKLVKDQIENEDSDLIILGHYGGFATYKQDGWSGYAMRMQDFITQVSGVNTLLAGPGILVTNPNGPVTTVSWDGTQGGGTDFTVTPDGPIQVAINGGSLGGSPVNVTNLDDLMISAIQIPSGLNWAGSWIEGQSAGYAADDVVWYEDPDTGVYYTYWAYNGAVPANHPLPTAGQASNDKWARLGLEGPTGKTGLSTAVLKLYQWSGTVPTVFPITDSVYTWTDGSFTLPPDYGLWSLTIPTNPNEGDILWEITQQYTDYPVGLVTNVTWTTTSPKPLAFYGFSGTDGKSVLSGSGLPASGLGVTGDFYIDITSSNYTMYGPKPSDNNWSPNTPKDLKGATGNDGRSVLSGSGVPSSGLGNVGDFYINLTSSNYTMYGPKTTNWTDNPTKDLKGNNGSITYSGSGTPPNGTGITGDYYINTSSTNYTMYGPKITDGSWTGANTVDLKGPQGAPGGAVIGVGGSIIGTPGMTISALNASSLIKLSTQSGNITVFVPDNLTSLPNGSQIMFVWDVRDTLEANSATFLALGSAVIKSANDMKYLRTLYSAATLIKITNTEYYLVGDLSPF